MPSLIGKTIEEHFHAIGSEVADRPLRLASDLAASPAPPRTAKHLWSRRPGWTRYSHDTPHSDGNDAADVRTEPVFARTVPFPDPADGAMVLDVETAYGFSEYPLLAVAVTACAWYSWVSPDYALLLATEDGNLGQGDTPPKDVQRFTGCSTLIPLGEDHVVVGHNVFYDRARVLQEYSLLGTRNEWIDTMSMHFALVASPRSTRPRMNRPDPPPAASLKDLANSYLGEAVSKEDRLLLATTDPAELIENFYTIMDYCATDVRVTKDLFSALLPKYLKALPDPTLFAGMLRLGKGFLPTDESWGEHIEAADDAFRRAEATVETSLCALADAALEQADSEEITNDPWLRVLDWEAGGQRAKTSELKGRPKWYRDLWSATEKRIKLTTSSRIAPYLLRLTWRGCPVYYSRPHGWLFRVPLERRLNFTETPVDLPTSPDHPDYDAKIQDELASGHYAVLKIPRADGARGNCHNPLALGFRDAYAEGVLASPQPSAAAALRARFSTAFWAAARRRVAKQLAVPTAFRSVTGLRGHAILLDGALAGASSPRTGGSVWAASPDAAPDVIGSESRSRIVAPEGYAFVGASVAEADQWLAPVLAQASRYGPPSSPRARSLWSRAVAGDKRWAPPPPGLEFFQSAVVAVDHLLRRLGVPGLLLLCNYDEIRYTVPSAQVELAALALQAGIAWTRQLYAHRLGLGDPALDTLLLDAVDIDSRLRKDVQADCVTPSSPAPLAPGRRLTLRELCDYFLQTHPLDPWKLPGGPD
ncbi:DNA-directed DNA polymerase gamma mip1 [Cladochytrium tenue]|nr:DNA-directed DNA polymerase gamma mip1 [Cladochytrium tenue]